MCLWSELMRMVPYLSGFYPQNIHPSLISREASENSQLRNIIENTRPVCFNTDMIIKNKESVRHNQEKPKET
jgi:hypothetical protein